MFPDPALAAASQFSGKMRGLSLDDAMATIPEISANENQWQVNDLTPIQEEDPQLTDEILALIEKLT